MLSNMLKLNDDKTEVILFQPKYKSRQFEFNVVVGDQYFQPSTLVRNLGVFFDDYLTMVKNVNSICRTCYMHLRNIGHIRRCLTIDATKQLVQGLVLSRLDYCNSLLYGLPMELINKLQRIQNTGARIIMRTKRRDHITPVLIGLHWLPVHRRIEYKILMHTYKALHGVAPQYIRDMLQIYQPTRSLRSETTTTLVIPRTRTVMYGDRSFRKAAGTLWNSLPLTVRESPTLETFKKNLKTHLFRLEFQV